MDQWLTESDLCNESLSSIFSKFVFLLSFVVTFPVLFHLKNFLQPLFNYSYRDLATVARAAVSGDEKALDMFDWQNSDQKRLITSQVESIQLFVGTKSGKKYLILHYIYICMSIYPVIYQSIYLFIYLSTYLPIHLSIYLSIYLSNKIVQKKDKNAVKQHKTNSLYTN